jgi:hypothetical protein
VSECPPAKDRPAVRGRPRARLRERGKCARPVRRARSSPTRSGTRSPASAISTLTPFGCAGESSCAPARLLTFRALCSTTQFLQTRYSGHYAEFAAGGARIGAEVAAVRIGRFIAALGPRRAARRNSQGNGRGALRLQQAVSESVFAEQRPVEYTAGVLAAALREGHTGFWALARNFPPIPVPPRRRRARLVAVGQVGGASREEELAKQALA